MIDHKYKGLRAYFDESIGSRRSKGIQAMYYQGNFKVVNINILSFDPMFSNSWMRPWMQGLRMRELLWKIIKLLKLEYESHTIIDFRPFHEDVIQKIILRMDVCMYELLHPLKGVLKPIYAVPNVVVGS